MFSALFEENSSRFCKSVWWHCSYCALGVCYDDNFSVTKDGWLCSQIVTLPVSIFLSLQAIVYSSRMIRVGLGKWLYTKPRWGMSRHLGTKRNVQISKVKWSVLILGQCESIFEKRPEKKNVFLLEFWNSAVSLQPPFMSVKSCSHSIFPLCHLPSVLSPLCAVFPLCHLPSVSSPLCVISHWFCFPPCRIPQNGPWTILPSLLGLNGCSPRWLPLWTPSLWRWTTWTTVLPPACSSKDSL